MKNRNTIQKQVILDYLKKTNKHPTTFELYEMIRKEMPNIGQATVYRNLKLMAKEGKIDVIPCKNNMNRYDGNISFHNHFICEKCGNIIDIVDYTQSDYSKLESEYGFQVKKESTVYRGICKNCIKALKNN